MEREVDLWVCLSRNRLEKIARQTRKHTITTQVRLAFLAVVTKHSGCIRSHLNLPLRSQKRLLKGSRI
jgi:hypothetical protein